MAGRGGHAARRGVLAGPFEPRLLDAELALAIARHDANRTRRAAEERERDLFLDAIAGIFRTGIDGTILEANPAFAALLGYGAPSELIGRDVRAMWADPRDREALVSRHRDDDFVSALEVRWRKRDGEPLLLELHGRIQHGADGEISTFLGHVRDVTEQRQHEAALRVLSTGLSPFTGAAFFHELAARLAEVVGAEVGVIGAFAREAPETVRTLSLVVDGAPQPPRSYALAGAPCERALGGETVLVACDAQARFPLASELQAHRAQGFAAAPAYDARGEVVAFVGIMTRRPIAHPKRIESIVRLFALRAGAELERQRSEERFAGVFEWAPDALLIVDHEGRILTANRQAEPLLGYSREELSGRSVDDLVPAQRRAAHHAMRASFRDRADAHRMGSERARLAALRKDGVEVPVEISLSPLESSRDRLIVAALRDVSERVRAEEERAALERRLRETQKMESLGTLAGGIAHDFNNVLTAILANLELARLEAEPGTPLAESLDEIASAGARAAQLVKQILAFSRKQPSKRVSVVVDEIVDEVAKLLRATLPAGIELVLKIQGGVPKVLADPIQLHQVLMNLGTNAWHAIERGTGRVTLRVDAVVLDEAGPAVPELPRGPYARLSVIDDGKGIPQSVIARIFEPFFTTKEIGKGTGLGLSVVHGIVSDHGGAVTVESQVGQGTRVSVYLPAAATSEPEVARRVPSRRGHGRVLLLDDELPVARVGARVLRRLGYEVTSYSRAADALAALRLAPDAFDVVVTDLNMPELSGLDVARTVGRLREDLPVVLVSGNRTLAEEDLVATNVCLYLEKPYTSDELSEAIARALRVRRGGALTTPPPSASGR
jgi:PAS domain S-box-containing protein